MSDDVESARLLEAAPFMDQEEKRPDFLPPERPPHPAVEALRFDLASRLEPDRTMDGDDDSLLLRDHSLWNLDAHDAFRMGYETAIHRLDDLLSEGMTVVLVTEDDVKEMTGETTSDGAV